MAGSEDLSGKVLFVTGAGRGIGRGIAEVAALAGADIAINVLTPRYVEEVAERIAKESSQRVIPIVGDVTTAEGANEAVAAVVDVLGALDVLVNCLGDAIGKPLVKLPGDERDAMTDEDVQKVMDLNLSATIVCTWAAGPHLLGRQGTSVVNISSFAAARRGAGSVIYATAKTALTGFTRALALEWAPFGVRVNAVAPGSFPDPVTSGERYEASRTRLAGEVPLGRAGEVQEIGYAVRFLASDAAAYITGQTLHVDGGTTL